ncbi:Fur family transcriptional regulator [Desulfosporosinus sp. PR]|uniref:Fur family transcriptional regulator n=1 Tax=Candidatus Desulfosporosinus nitrosoreducens TaxID=3401928 RepID=UPI0027F1BC5D|nr:Fur family transcriptional regulator [Desulfosporosinus sp. PR]MDQ7093771.1 Fur family transcriptional regulator [Desulfosporosinus sp. PR]
MSENQKILKQLKESGYRFTGKRKEIVDLFVEYQERYLTAKEVYEHIRKSYPSISYDTIYRTLALLRQMKVIEEMEYGDEAVRYRLSCGHGHHHHLVCLGCGSIRVVHDCPMELIHIDQADFTVVDHRFEITGYCSDCRLSGRY